MSSQKAQAATPCLFGTCKVAGIGLGISFILSVHNWCLQPPHGASLQARTNHAIMTGQVHSSCDANVGTSVIDLAPAVKNTKKCGKHWHCLPSYLHELPSSSPPTWTIRKATSRRNLCSGHIFEWGTRTGGGKKGKPLFTNFGLYSRLPLFLPHG